LGLAGSFRKLSVCISMDHFEWCDLVLGVVRNPFDNVTLQCIIATDGIASVYSTPQNLVPPQLWGQRTQPVSWARQTVSQDVVALTVLSREP